MTAPPATTVALSALAEDVQAVLALQPDSDQPTLEMSRIIIQLTAEPNGSRVLHELCTIDSGFVTKLEELFDRTIGQLPPLTPTSSSTARSQYLKNIAHFDLIAQSLLASHAATYIAQAHALRAAIPA